ncbi:MAG TPA: ABC transporter permease [Candidatus Saccharimonadales bacterium]|jgi:putative ABC transport system permease protein|nr:ABC transporter permease [Candidatus Saccharimonadales bacterium]
MKMRDTVRRAGRSLRQAKARTLLTSLAIGVGAFTITLAFAAGEGGRQYASDIVSANTNEHELYVQMKQDDSSDPTAPKEYSNNPTVQYGSGFSVKMLGQNDIKALESIADVVDVTPLYNVTAKYITASNQKKYTIGVETFQPAVKLEYVAGGGVSRKGSAVIPESLRTVLGFASAESAIGKTVTIAIDKSPQGLSEPTEIHHTLTIVGVNEASSLAVADGSGSVRIDRDTARELYEMINEGTANQRAYTAATVVADEGADVAVVKKAINDAGDYDAQTAEDAMSFLFQFINVLQGILLGFGALAVLTSIFGIINTQYISVLERTQQIGLMKALGMRRRDVGRLFRYEAAWVGFLGGAIGAGAAVLAGVIANPYISDALNLGQTSLLIFQPLAIAGVVVGLMIVSVTAGILPARKAAKLDPIEALRTE